MDLKQLQEMGGFVSPTPVLKQGSWTRTPEGASEERTDPFSIHVKKLSFGDIEKLLSDDNKRTEHQRMSAFIAATVLLGDEGKQPLSYKDAYRLDPSLASAFMTLINEVNGTKGPAPKANGANGTDDGDAAKN